VRRAWFCWICDASRFMHRVIARVTEVSLALLDQAEGSRVLAVAAEPGALHAAPICDECASPWLIPDAAHDCDLTGMAQIFSSVSPAMHQEFDLAYRGRCTLASGWSIWLLSESAKHQAQLGEKRSPTCATISMKPGRTWSGARSRSPTFFAQAKPALRRAMRGSRRRSRPTCAHGRGLHAPWLSGRVDPQGYQHRPLTSRSGSGVGKDRPPSGGRIGEHRVSVCSSETGFQK